MLKRFAAFLVILLCSSLFIFADGFKTGVEIKSEAKYAQTDDPETQPLNLTFTLYPYFVWDNLNLKLKFKVQTGKTGDWSSISTSLDNFRNIKDAYDAIGAVMNMVDRFDLAKNFSISTGSKFMDTSTLFLGTYKEASDAKLMLANWSYRDINFEFVHSDVIFKNYGQNKNLPLETFIRGRFAPFGNSKSNISVSFVRESINREDGFGTAIPALSIGIGNLLDDSAGVLHITAEGGLAAGGDTVATSTRAFGSAGLRYQLDTWELESGAVYNANKHFTGLINPKVSTIPEAEGLKVMDFYLSTRYKTGNITANLLVSVPFNLADNFSLYQGYDSWWLYAGYDTDDWAVSIESSLAGLISKNFKFNEIFSLTGTLKLSFLTLKGKMYFKMKDGKFAPEFKLTTSMKVGTDTLINEKNKAFWEPETSSAASETETDKGIRIHGGLDTYFDFGVIDKDNYYNSTSDIHNYEDALDHVVFVPHVSVRSEWLDLGLRYKFYLARDSVKILPRPIDSVASAFYIIDYLKVKDYLTIKEKNQISDFVSGINVSDYKMDRFSMTGNLAGFSAFADYITGVPNLFGVGYESSGKFYLGGQVVASVENADRTIFEFYPAATAGYRFDAGVTAELNAMVAIPTAKNNDYTGGYLFTAKGEYNISEIFTVGLNAGLQKGDARFRKYSDTKRSAVTVNNPLDPQVFWEAEGSLKVGAFDAKLQYGMEMDTVRPDSVDFITLSFGYSATGFKASIGFKGSGFLVAPDGTQRIIGNMSFGEILTNNGLNTSLVASMSFTYKFIEAYCNFDNEFVKDSNGIRVGKRPYLRFGIKAFF